MLLRSKASRKLPLSELLDEFAEFHGKSPQITKLGFDHPTDLFEALEKDIKAGIFLFFCNYRFSNSCIHKWRDLLLASILLKIHNWKP